MNKFTYSLAEFDVEGKAELCGKINRRLRPGQRVFSIDYICFSKRGSWYGVIFETEPPLKLSALISAKIKKARAART